MLNMLYCQLQSAERTPQVYLGTPNNNTISEVSAFQKTSRFTCNIG